VVTKVRTSQLIPDHPHPPAIGDVAQAAGVSRATASRALSGYGRVSRTTVEKVKEAAKQLEYRPNTIARSMRSGRTKTIGLVIIADLTSAFFARATKSIVAEARFNGLSVLIVNTDEYPTSEREAVETLLEKQVDGLIVVIASASEHPHLESQNLRGTPVILVDRSIDQLELTSVTTDDFNGARMAVEYALSLGHRRLGFAAIVGPEKAVSSGIPSGLISTTQQRIDGFISGAITAGIPKSELFWTFCGATIEETAQGVGRLLDAEAPPTILVAANNDIALGIITCATQRNLVIGQDLSLIMFDDSPWAAVPPGITVVARPVDELGSIAVTQLLAEITRQTTQRTQIVLPTSLVIRGSVVDLRASPDPSPLTTSIHPKPRSGNELT
jgi:LacI family transcriptional regulator